MDVKAYIETGILEQYALGEVSDQERREVECLSKIYPEIKTALSEIEEDLERMSKAGAVAPPQGLKDKILTEVRQHRQDEVGQTQEHSSKTYTATEPPAKSAKRTIVWAAAASLALLLAIWQFLERESLQHELADAEEAQREMLAKENELENQLDRLKAEMETTLDPSYRKIVLEPTKSKEAKGVSLLWEDQSGQVKINLASLPELPEDKQYQLWVLKDGQPSDMGVLPKNSQELYRASSQTLDGDSFAITVEPLGGKPTPSLDQLVYMGKV
mgnify:CR=1 FL=1